MYQNDIKEWNKIKNLNYDEQHKLFSDYCPKDSDKKRPIKNYEKPQCNIMIICDILYIKYNKYNITLGYVFVYKLYDFYLKNHTIYHKKTIPTILLPTMCLVENMYDKLYS